MYGAYDNGSLVGVIATRILRNSLAETITVHSSPYAVEIYHQLGFTAADGEKTEHGIRYTPMKYQK